MLVVILFSGRILLFLLAAVIFSICGVLSRNNSSEWPQSVNNIQRLNWKPKGSLQNGKKSEIFHTFFTRSGGGCSILIFTLFILCSEWPNSSRNTNKNFYYHVNFHTLGVGGVKNFTLFFYFEGFPIRIKPLPMFISIF